ncbi:MAG: hypothetical protein GFH27_549301n50 [Chloroflexi bacterium AL-W]|nr:hypothetical protein [Chloroflexi bacterium AL-N1]NOK68243.1 hypothetical protein [Chloroflexi bacterium AL-N10]NOK73889.1 hypothetical protein [Chloroflexi bacterium AL-N5]NOK82857.1 hypothetical protein [Chloroflexi bacterium AL-W]NOK90379.1 hypothetical protein [Chloroflexi bacterium AL-N15]
MFTSTSLVKFQRTLINHGHLLISITVGCVLLGLIGAYLPGIDHLPLIWALRIELAGGSAYGPEMATMFQQHYNTLCHECGDGGFAYPLPAMWFALPVVGLPDILARAAWCVLSVGSVVLGLFLLRMRPVFLLFIPLWYGAIEMQVTVLLVGLTLIALWSYRQQHWWLLGVLVALIGLSKPQTTGLFAIVFGLFMVRHHQWKPLLVSVAILGITFVLEPSWLTQWLTNVSQYRSNLQPRWLLMWLPIALIPAMHKRLWPTLAIELCLFPAVSHAYTLLPLLIGYSDLRKSWMAWCIVGSAWAMVFLQSHIPEWLLLGLCYFIPFGLVTIYNQKSLSPKH